MGPNEHDEWFSKATFSIKYTDVQCIYFGEVAYPWLSLWHFEPRSLAKIYQGGTVNSRIGENVYHVISWLCE